MNFETPTPYEHIIIKFKLNMPTRNGTRAETYEKKGWFDPIDGIYLVPREWESCSYGQRPRTLDGFRLEASEVVSWKKI